MMPCPCWTEEIEMSMETHLAELQRKHSELSDKVEQAQKTLGSNDIAIAKMKKQKLRIKEEIYRLSS